MAPTRQVCHRQLELIVEFAEANKAIALGNAGKGPLGQQDAHKAWEELARRLNSIGGGIIKTPTNWKRYWHVLKCRTKGKAADIRRSHGGTGGGPYRTIPLSDLEQRIVSIIGKVAVEGIPEVRVPFDLIAEMQPTCSSSGPTQSTASASSNELEFLEVEQEGTGLAHAELEIYQNDFPIATESSGGAPAVAESSGGGHAAAESLLGALTPAENSGGVPAAAMSSRRAPIAATKASRKIFRPRRNRDENLPRWAYELEERRIAVEERMVEEIAGLGATNKLILESMQQLVQLLGQHVKNK